MSEHFSSDIYSEPVDVDPDTLGNLGPLSPLAGIWEGARGTDVHPEAEGPAQDSYLERYELQPIDPQTNGPQLFYGLRYHIHVTRTGKPGTFHDQVGYWLWEPAARQIILTLTIPRGQIAMAAGRCEPGARHFELACAADSPHWGTCSNPFLDQAFKTLRFTLAVTVHHDGSWSYEQDTVLRIQGRDDEFHHTDRNTLRRIAAPTPNPLMRPPG